MIEPTFIVELLPLAPLLPPAPTVIVYDALPAMLLTLPVLYPPAPPPPLLFVKLLPPPPPPAITRYSTEKILKLSGHNASLTAYIISFTVQIPEASSSVVFFVWPFIPALRIR
jgi:hypothetical protein